MKKLMVFLLVGTIVVLFSGCVSELEKERENISAKTYTVAIDPSFAPFSFEDEYGALIGIDKDLLDAVAADQGLNLEYRAMSFEEAVENDEVDILISGIKMSMDRKEKIAFTSPYLQSGVVMITHKNNTTVKTIEDLKSKTGKRNKVAVKQNSDAEKLANALTAAYDFEVIYMRTSAEVFDSVANGDTLAGFDESICAEYSINQGKPLQMVLDKQLVRSYGFALKKDSNPLLMKLLDEGIQNILNCSEYEEILDHYKIKL